MPFILKLAITNLIIVACVRIGKNYPSLGGLIATMPLTSLLVLVWLHLDNPGDSRLLTEYTKGVLWGILPTVFFFVAVYLSFRRQAPLSLALALGFGVWLAGALIHHWLVR